MTTQGKRIHKIRKKLGLSQDEFGKHFNFSHAFVSAVENDKSNMSVENLKKLLDDYNVNINYILSGIEPMFLQNHTSQFEQVKNELAPFIKQLIAEELKNRFS